MENIIEVTSVNEFIKAVEDYNNSLTKIFGYWNKLSYFRGESKNYGETKITSYAIREKYDYEKLCQEFYNEISHKLTQDEKDNFLAFSQHHGIPTNLIDISSNPLVSLWFACSENFKETAFVYCFNNRNVDITSMIEEMGIKSLPIRISKIENNRFFHRNIDITEIVDKSINHFLSY
jgi:hypothetical protein